ncbi:hypothetical protein CN154_23180 [Sinorhizobium meliloti]|uniref:hypothetical protein n=1 Tax=Rhizobium meliloti TaxID=382 RepID=UPI000FD95F70|nr:hypothetical protein [Sinorhizobium meliloti]MDX0283612.1 hypothetical protein [Sinorhizobium meliloti]RVK71622.1 hypothetical protein CN154_23180 [Sinorhizobium meliloti]RVL30207.1 hypothetical protein CN144_14600 [Sinorhizobium meliloti]
MSTERQAAEQSQATEGTDDRQPEGDDLEELEALDVETLQARTNEALDHFRETHSEAQQTFIAEAFIDAGEIPTGEAFGITEAQARTVEAGYIRTMERDVFSQHGLSYDQWLEHVADEDLPTFRRAAIKGDWTLFHRHASQCAAMRRELGI